MVNWDHISKQKGLSEQFMRENKDKLNWKRIGEFQTLSESFLIEMEEYIDWLYTSAFQTFTPALIKRYYDRIYWSLLSKNKHLTTEIMMEYRNDLNWNNIYFHHPEKFKRIKDIVGAEEKIDWNTFHIDAQMEGKLDTAFLLQHKERLDWTHILTSYFVHINPSIAERVKEHVDWDEVSSKKLKEIQLETLQNYLNWDRISVNPNIHFSYLRVKKYANRLNIPLLMEHHILTEDTLEWLHVHKKIDWEKVATHQKPIYAFTETFIGEIDIFKMKECSPTLYTEEQWDTLCKKKKKSQWKRPLKTMKQFLKRA